VKLSSKTKRKLRRKARFWASRSTNPVEWTDLLGMLYAATINRKRNR
jgi:hypothetical protein